MTSERHPWGKGVSARDAAHVDPRNPLVRLPSMVEARGLLDNAQREALALVLWDLQREANRMAEESWRKRKGPMAAYWRSVATYARHTRLALCAPTIESEPEKLWSAA